MVIQAIYENGVFRPRDEAKIENGTVVEVYVPQTENLRPRSIRDLEFTGMWADRDDIIDGVSYVNRLRDNRRG